MANIQTLKLAVDANALDSPESDKALRQAAKILRCGGTVAFPTETVYGLGANALNAAAVERIFEAKQRPSWDPLIVHIVNTEQLERVVEEIPAKARLLMDAFWPGPLTLLLPKSSSVPAIVTAGRRLVGVRMPQHPVARRLIELAELPIAAPSANKFGRTSPTRAQFVLEDLDGRIDAVVDGGKTNLGLESTVVDVCEEPPVLHRPGMVTFEQIRSIVGTLVGYQAPEGKAPAPEAQPSPGGGLQHYAPHARLVLFDVAAIGQGSNLARRLQAEGETVGVMLPDEYRSTELSGLNLVYRWGKWSDKGELALRLFAGLRELDALGASVILCPLPDEEGIGTAIRDRLTKAARKQS